MKKLMIGLLISLMIVAPVAVSARGTNPSGATQMATGQVANPDDWGALDVTGYLAGTDRLMGSNGINWRGRYYEYGFTGNQAVYFSVVVLQEKVEQLESTINSMQAQINSLQMSQNPVGGYPEQAPVVIQQQAQVDLTPRVEQLEKRVGYLEMALDYFNGWVVKFKTVLKIK